MINATNLPFRLRRGLLALLVLQLMAWPAFSQTPVQDQTQANSTSGPMYFHSYVKDADDCSMSATGNSIRFSDDIPSPAATCPDAFGWKSLLDAINSEFWVNWANDETIWVSSPKPLCASDKNTDCCFVDSGAQTQVGYRDKSGKILKPDDIGGPGKYCPYIPGDWGGADETTFAGAKAQTSHNTTFLRKFDPARIARQREVEVVYRNDAFTQYTTSAKLYSVEGLKTLFSEASGEANNSAPYRPTKKGISYPGNALMFKVDWIPLATMLELGYVKEADDGSPPQNADNPYVTMKIRTPNQNKDSSDQYMEEIYYLAAITGASKALPNWHWFAFEHVSNLGRCDYTGCNDSYGFLTAVTIKAPDWTDKNKKTMTFQSNFIRPHTESDQLQDQTDLLVRGKVYPSGEIQAELSGLFSSLNVGTGDGSKVNPDMPNKQDPAWQSYRLKGTQTQYYMNDGYPTIVGASITEGGFVNTASCMSCHVQAGVGADGKASTSVGGTGRLNLDGMGKVVRGAPYIGDYYTRGSTTLRTARTDFVWGILFAQ